MALYMGGHTVKELGKNVAGVLANTKGGERTTREQGIKK